ncbi:phosphatidylinositol-binding protein scs2 [Pleurotus pulmonarius]|nr:phosphatidylinositol-binding protein scs2 [Pleurotus pulmonarius]KAF4593106.1 phosphatidylinositol-binding protein scs2 [Pleurotus pulmonarius]KAF4594000.1 phosphatidylinositol-binding protein scs2 [Pleurotus pulmonarius]
MSVILHPTDVLTFQRPFNEVITQRLILTNHNAEPVAFKVKTSAPLKYLVRPNKGRAEPGESLEISIFLQPMRTEPPPDYICPDKFLIQSTFITADREKLSLTDIWNAPVMSVIHEIHGQKLRVTYLPSDYTPPQKMTYSELESKYKDALLEIERLKTLLEVAKPADEKVRAVFIRPWTGAQGHY